MQAGSTAGHHARAASGRGRAAGSKGHGPRQACGYAIPGARARKRPGAVSTRGSGGLGEGAGPQPEGGRGTFAAARGRTRSEREYRRGDSNPYVQKGHWILSPARLPVPPLRRAESSVIYNPVLPSEARPRARGSSARQQRAEALAWHKHGSGVRGGARSSEATAATAEVALSSRTGGRGGPKIASACTRAAACFTCSGTASAAMPSSRPPGGAARG
jgi:hypothetical protein